MTSSSPIFARAGQLRTRLGASDHKDNPAAVAEQTFDALMAGRERVVAASLASKLAGTGLLFIPDRITSQLNGFLARAPAGKSGLGT